MDSYLEDICESIDAVVFTGDTLYNEDTRKEFILYLDRWKRGVKDFEQSNDGKNQKGEQA